MHGMNTNGSIFYAEIQDDCDFGRVIERWAHWDRDWLMEQCTVRCAELEYWSAMKHKAETGDDMAVLFSPNVAIVEVDIGRSYWQTRSGEEQKAAVSNVSDVIREEPDVGISAWLDHMGINEDGSPKIALEL